MSDDKSRPVGIIGHVDSNKTSLTAAIVKYFGTAQPERNHGEAVTKTNPPKGEG